LPPYVVIIFLPPSIARLPILLYTPPLHYRHAITAPLSYASIIIHYYAAVFIITLPLIASLLRVFALLIFFFSPLPMMIHVSAIESIACDADTADALQPCRGVPLLALMFLPKMFDLFQRRLMRRRDTTILR